MPRTVGAVKATGREKARAAELYRRAHGRAPEVDRFHLPLPEAKYAAGMVAPETVRPRALMILVVKRAEV